MVSAFLPDLQTDEKVKAVDATATKPRYEGAVTEKQSKLAAVHAPTAITDDDDAPRHDRSNQNQRRSFHRR